MRFSARAVPALNAVSPLDHSNLRSFVEGAQRSLARPIDASGYVLFSGPLKRSETRDDIDRRAIVRQTNLPLAARPLRLRRLCLVQITALREPIDKIARSRPGGSLVIRGRALERVAQVGASRMNLICVLSVGMSPEPAFVRVMR